MTHAELSTAFTADVPRTDWHDETLWLVRQKRDKAAAALGEQWEILREQASAIKRHTLSQLADYLEQFERQAQANGVQVHWAADAAEHNQIVTGILQEAGIHRIVKSKSMLTEECRLNEYLQSRGIEVVDTDLGEHIVQLAGEPPSHIVLPCIHKKKAEIGALFHEHLGTPAGCEDPQELTEAARQHLREKFLTREAAITGVNFAVAETGEFVVCTNEGNADMGAQLARVHIACMGIEKIIPTRADLGVFLRLLARSATGQAITTYTSHFRRPRAGQTLHIVLVDNGRSRLLAQPDFREALKCIRCGACLNTCPVYRRSGGHSYRQAIAGPIGAILAPNLDREQFADLPFASTLCGSCTHVCPVKINIHEQLYQWRQVLTREGNVPAGKKRGMQLLAAVLQSPRLFQFAGSAGRFLLRQAPWLLQSPWNIWSRKREMPSPPPQSFESWYRQNRPQQ
jgi:L-lactate dehydrogenase complex protein LldF